MEAIKSINPSAFDGCPKLTRINIPKSLEDSSLVSFRSKLYPDNQTEEFDVRENGALFKYNGTSAHVVIPNVVKIISANAFSENHTIKSIVIPKGVVIIEFSAFMRCTTLEQVDMPDSVKSIGAYAFQGCYYLGKV